MVKLRMCMGSDWECDRNASLRFAYFAGLHRDDARPGNYDAKCRSLRVFRHGGLRRFDRALLNTEALVRNGG